MSTYRNTANEFLQYGIDHAASKYARTVADMTTAMAMGRVQDYDLRELAKAQAVSDIYRQIENLSHHEVDLVEAAEILAADWTRELLRARGESRSTSAMSNVVEDINLEAKALFIREWTQTSAALSKEN